MTDQSKVSVIIPAFNAETFIARAVRSALNQTEPPLEVIVADDASTDRTREVVGNLIATDGRVRLIKLSTNSGPGAARNAAIQAAKGTWVALLDADDAYLGSRLETLVTIGNTYKADIVADNIGLFDVQAQKFVSNGVNSLRQIHVINRYEYVSQCRGNREDIDWGLLHPIFRRHFLEAHKLRYSENLRHGEDFAFVLSAFLADAKFVFTPEMGYLYTQRHGTVSDSPSGMSRTRVDFESMVRHTLSLMKDPRVRRDGQMLSLMRRRYHALRAIDVHHRMPNYLKTRDVSNIAKLLTYDLDAWRILMIAVRGKASALIRPQ
jgi:succinoglycan biosynthesis protein ExoO